MLKVDVREGEGMGVEAGNPPDVFVECGATLMRACPLRPCGVHVLLDLWGVLLDSETMFRGYREKVAEILSRRFGGAPDAWRRAHDEAFVSYLKRVNEIDWDARAWAETVDTLDAENVLEMFSLAGVEARPQDPLALARELEFDAMASVDARFPDARAAIERLHAGGHTVHVATQASGTNAWGALTGARLIDAIDGIFTGHTQNALKARPRYWSEIPRSLGVPPRSCVLVDDRLDYLEAAASVGVLALLLDRKAAHRPESLPAYVQATLRTLAALPHWVESQGPAAAEGG